MSDEIDTDPVNDCVTATGFGYYPQNMVFDDFIDYVGDENVATEIAWAMLRTGESYPWNEEQHPRHYMEFDVFNADKLREQILAR